MKKPSVPLDVLFQALGDRTRLRLLNLVALGEVCVCYFVEILGEPQPKISRHLAYLRNAGLVSTRRDGKWMHYRLAKLPDPQAAKVVKAVLAALAADAQMQRDQRALRAACCAPKPLIADAPLPALQA
ncbi:MAG: metalloregulator ArsR/SmtB family transcription factor [Acidobacteriota bacterium]|nr:metalloregulator ArsR/SmtB family transcription factor [Acidobacteriota bacterium]